MKYKIKSRIWIESNNKTLMGEGRVRLLKAIDEMGSLSRAASQLNMSYKKAWTLMDAVNKSSTKPVVTTLIGGKNGGGAQLTPYGKSLVITFEEINKNCWDYLDTQLQKINKL